MLIQSKNHPMKTETEIVIIDKNNHIDTLKQKLIDLTKYIAEAFTVAGRREYLRQYYQTEAELNKLI